MSDNKTRIAIPVEDIISGADYKVRRVLRAMPIAAHGVAFWLSIPEFVANVSDRIDRGEQITAAVIRDDMRNIFDARFDEAKRGGRPFYNYRVGLGAIKDLEKSTRRL